MNIKQFLEKATDNWLAKVVCLILAILIYLFYQFSSLDKKVYTLPLTIYENGSMVSATKNKQYVKVTIKGKSEDLATVTENDVTAYLDVSSETEEGSYKFPVLIKTSERLMLMEPLEVKVSPEEEKISIQKKEFKYVPLKPSFSGEVAHGYEQSDYKIEPNTIRIEGPRLMVESIDSIQTTEINVTNMENTVSIDALPVNQNSLISLNEKEKIKVTVNIVQAKQQKTYDNIKINYDNLSDDFEVKSKVQTSSVNVTGNVLDIEKTQNSEIQLQVDCKNIKSEGEYGLFVNVIIPSVLSLDSLSVEKIKINVVQKKVESAESTEFINKDSTFENKMQKQ